MLADPVQPHLRLGRTEDEQGGGQGVVVADPARGRHRLQRPSPALLELLLAHPDHRDERVELHRHGLCGVTRLRWRVLEPATGLGHDPQRRSQRAGALVHPRPASEDPSPVHRVRGERGRPPIRLHRPVEHAGEPAQLAEDAPQLRPVRIGDTRHPPAHLERPLVHLRGVDVGIGAPRLLSGRLRIAPRPLGVPRPPEVQRQRRGVRGQVGAHLLQRQAGGAVQRRPDPIGQPFVGGVADEAVAEAQPARAVGLEEAGESPLVRGGHRHPVGRQRPVEHLAPEAASEHGAVAQHPAGVRRQGVDLSAHRGADGLGQGLHRARPEGDPRHLLDEERVALGPVDDGGDLVRPQRGRLRRGDDETLDDRGGQRRQRHPGGRLGVEAACLAAADGHDEPLPSRRGRGDPVEQRRRRGVGPVRLLRDDDDPSLQRALREADDGVGEPVGPVLRVELVHLERRRHVDLGHVGEQRRIGEQVRGEPLQAREQRPAHRLRVGALDAEESSHRVPQHPVGAGRAIGFGPQDDEMVDA